MFGNNTKYINEYSQLLKQLTYLGANFKNDDDKIKALSIINNLKHIAYKIEPQASIDYYNKHYK